MSTTFKKNKEDFVCAKCGLEVEGNGFTNHCPKCLHSLHVDINPGDRGADCGGLMEPSKIEGTQKGYVIVHKCLVCGHEKKNKVSMEDSIDTITEIARRSF